MTPKWYRDPVVGVFVVVGVIGCAWAVFGGRYLPYQDWAGHVGLSAVLASGDETGADAYLTRSLVPTPYYLFYVSTAALGNLLTIETAAKVNLLIATVVATTGAARLAEATGRSPRLAGLAPLVLFGVSLGLGFASFVVGLPWILHALAETEILYSDRTNRRWAAVRLAVFLVLCFLGHGLVFLFAALLIGVRSLGSLLRPPRDVLAVVWTAAAGASVLIVALPSVLRRVDHRYVSPEFMAGGGPAVAGWVPWSTHVKTFAGDLLDRGGSGHFLTMAMVVVWVTVIVVARVWLGRHDAAQGKRSPQDGLPIYAAVTTAIFLFGPAWMGWPVTFWVIYQRAGTLAALLLSLLPRTNLSSPAGAAIALLAAIPVLHNGIVNRAQVAAYSAYAAPYDRIRAAIPRRQRVLGLSEGITQRPGDTLYFYHLVDGASYVPIGNIPEEVPVHRRNSPGTPYNPSAGGFDPRSHGRMYDYVVVHGSRLKRRLQQSRTHVGIADAGGWTVYRTLAPLPPTQVRW